MVQSPWPGDDRGWTEYRHGWRPEDMARKVDAALRMTEQACILGPVQRRTVEKTIAEHCVLRGWLLHAVNCRTNHVHVVVAAKVRPEQIRDQLKAWCTRKLNELEKRQKCNIAARTKWWSERCSRRYLNSVDDLESAILYVRDGQDRSR